MVPHENMVSHEDNCLFLGSLKLEVGLIQKMAK